MIEGEILKDNYLGNIWVVEKNFGNGAVLRDIENSKNKLIAIAGSTRMMFETIGCLFEKQNKEPINISHKKDPETGETALGFSWDKKTYFLDYFTSVHDNPSIYDNYPSYIDGYDATADINPIYIQMLDNQVNIFIKSREECEFE